ncbi:uncharacterized protein LOC141819152 [Curcuma longa]|uniref:uncharacterized protein LOC141819152 n=1 Tax=Curcuma longa TaxID=136217 RepID=UPI003D9FA5A2
MTLSLKPEEGDAEQRGSFGEQGGVGEETLASAEKDVRAGVGFVEAFLSSDPLRHKTSAPLRHSVNDKKISRGSHVILRQKPSAPKASSASLRHRKPSQRRFFLQTLTFHSSPPRFLAKNLRRKKSSLLRLSSPPQTDPRFFLQTFATKNLRPKSSPFPKSPLHADLPNPLHAFPKSLRSSLPILRLRRRRKTHGAGGAVARAWDPAGLDLLHVVEEVDVVADHVGHGLAGIHTATISHRWEAVGVELGQRILEAPASISHCRRRTPWGRGSERVAAMRCNGKEKRWKKMKRDLLQCVLIEQRMIA